MKKEKYKEVIVRFRYDVVTGKDDDYYKDKAYNEIYNSDFYIEDFEVYDRED